MKEITFIVSTHFFGPVVQRALMSLSQNIKRFSHACNLLILDKSPGAAALNWLGKEDSIRGAFSKVFQLNTTAIHDLESENIEYLQNAEVEVEKDSIQRTRVQMLLAIRHFSEEIEDSILWQLDDDMVFDYHDSDIPFPDVIGKVLAFHHENPEVDAATGTGFHTPPLPVMLYLEKNLNDLFAGKPIPLQGISTSPEYYHDLYTEVDRQEISHKVERSPVEFENLLSQILSGDPVFRPIPNMFFKPEEIWHRGGNFIFFNLEAAIAMPHLALNYQGLTSRRSDMIHARLLNDAGFKLAGIPLGLHHFRDNHSLPDLSKLKLEYLRDALGAIAVRFLENDESAFKRLADHLAHINRLSVLVDKINRSFHSPIVEQLLVTLRETRNDLSAWNQKELAVPLTELKKRYNRFLNSFQDE